MGRQFKKNTPLGRQRPMGRQLVTPALEFKKILLLFLKVCPRTYHQINIFTELKMSKYNHFYKAKEIPLFT